MATVTPPKQPSEAARYVVEFRPLKSRVPADARLRALLKIALRQFALRCVRLESSAEPKL